LLVLRHGSGGTVVTDWNDATLDAIRAGATAATIASRSLAILHVSMYDAVNGIARNNVVPPAEASAAIEAEIERRVSGLTERNLAETEARTIERKVNAKPRTFVEKTLLAIDDVIDTLKSNHATASEVRFVNPVADPNWDFGHIKLGVRYVTE
jgi:hypothetical protein